MHKCALRTARTRCLHPLFAQTFRPPRITHPPTSIRMSSTARIEVESLDLANLHISVDPEGKQVVDLIFASESLGMPAADGYGWVQFEFGDKIGRANRYTIARKLGWGMHSSTRLARDSMSAYRLLSCYYGG